MLIFVVDFSCALSREILLQGRIYIAQGWFCFYSNIFGWETQVNLKFSIYQTGIIVFINLFNTKVMVCRIRDKIMAELQDGLQVKF